MQGPGKSNEARAGDCRFLLGPYWGYAAQAVRDVSLGLKSARDLTEL